MIAIRKYKHRDQEQIKNLIYSVLKAIFHSTPKGLEDLNNIEKNFEKFWIAEEKGKIIGVIGFKIKKEEARISRMYVKKEFRERKIGKLLMNNLLGYCKKRGFRKIFLTTYKQMNSEKFYKKMGFKTTKKKDDIIFMEKLLV